MEAAVRGVGRKRGHSGRLRQLIKAIPTAGPEQSPVSVGGGHAIKTSASDAGAIQASSDGNNQGLL